MSRAREEGHLPGRQQGPSERPSSCVNSKKFQELSKFFESGAPGVQQLTIDPASTSAQSLRNTHSTNAVSLDTVLLGSVPPPQLQNGSTNSVESRPPCEALEIHRQLRADLVEISDGEDSIESDEDFQEVPKPKKPKTNYDRIQRFQNEWAAKLVWAEAIRGSDGKVHLVKCTVCSTFEKKPKILGPKWDTLTKHEGQRKAAFDMPKFNVKAGEWYVSKTSRHQINLRHFATRQPSSILEQVNLSTSTSKSKKIVQFSTLYQILSSGRPMVEYEERQALYAFLNVPNLPRMHWTESTGWKMAIFLYEQVRSSIRKKITSASFLALTCDEVTSVDNNSWLCIHAYVVDNYVRIPHLISLQHLVDGSGVDSLTLLIMKALETGGDLTCVEISRRLLCFGADVVSTFQGARTGVTTQIATKYAPFCMGVHCVAHRCNLAAKSLSSLPIFGVIEQVIQKTHVYFSKNPKRLSEYQKFAEVMETQGLKPLLQVTTRWVSLLELLRRLLAEYRTLLAKMEADSTKNDAAQKCLGFMIDPYALCGMMALMPLLKSVDLLVTFAQKRDVYICDFVVALKIAEGQLYNLYVDTRTAFATDEFWAFKNILNCSYNQINMQWVSDLNNGFAQLVFTANGEKIWAVHDDEPVDRDVLDSLVVAVKTECTGAAKKLLRELDSRFPSHAIMDPLGIVYPQYWLQPEAEEYFPKHLSVFISYYCEPKLIHADKKCLVPPILDRHSLETQQGLFKLVMLNNSKKHLEPPFELNPLTRLWRYLDTCIVLKVKAFPEFYKLAEIAIIVHVLGSVEDKRCFSSLSFLKNKLRNSLDAHLECVVGMYSQTFFTLENFPYDNAYNEWSTGAD